MKCFLTVCREYIWAVRLYWQTFILDAINRFDSANKMFACTKLPLCVQLWHGRVSHSEICADPSALTPRLRRILHLFPPHALLVYMTLLEQMHRGSNKDLKQEELNLEGLVYPKNENFVIFTHFHIPPNPYCEFVEWNLPFKHNKLTKVLEYSGKSCMDHFYRMLLIYHCEYRPANLNSETGHRVCFFCSFFFVGGGVGDIYIFTFLRMQDAHTHLSS